MERRLEGLLTYPRMSSLNSYFNFTAGPWHSQFLDDNKLVSILGIAGADPIGLDRRAMIEVLGVVDHPHNGYLYTSWRV